MKIVHTKGSDHVTFYPSGRLISKLRTILKLVHYKLDAYFQDDETEPIYYNITKSKSRKKYITYLPTLIKSHYKNDVVIFFKFKKRKGLRIDNDNDNPSNFYYFNWYMNANSAGARKKITPENILVTAVELALERYDEMIRKFGLEYEYAPLHSLVIKMI